MTEDQNGTVTLEITNCTFKDEGEYQCVASSDVGSVSCTGAIRVKGEKLNDDNVEALWIWRLINAHLPLRVKWDKSNARALNFDASEAGRAECIGQALNSVQVLWFATFSKQK